MLALNGTAALGTIPGFPGSKECRNINYGGWFFPLGGILIGKWSGNIGNGGKTKSRETWQKHC